MTATKHLSREARTTLLFLPTVSISVPIASTDGYRTCESICHIVLNLLLCIDVCIFTVVIILGFSWLDWTEQHYHLHEALSITYKGGTMKLGAFSASLSVKDIHASKQFYENLGFSVFAGDIEKKYLIMKNENALIGLFQGMFENNILTFNPGWDENANNIEEFDDVREIQRQLQNKGIKIDHEADATTSGPASVILTDPDGNVIYIDQHR